MIDNKNDSFSNFDDQMVRATKHWSRVEPDQTVTFGFRLL